MKPPKAGVFATGDAPCGPSGMTNTDEAGAGNGDSGLSLDLPANPGLFQEVTSNDTVLYTAQKTTQSFMQNKRLRIKH